MPVDGSWHIQPRVCTGPGTVGSYITIIYYIQIFFSLTQAYSVGAFLQPAGFMLGVSSASSQ